MKKFYKVYYRSKVNAKGICYVISDKTSKRAAIVATHIYVNWRDRGGHYAPICYTISEDEFNEHTNYNEGREHIRW